MTYDFPDIKVQVYTQKKDEKDGKPYSYLNKEGVEFIPYLHVANFRNWKAPESETKIKEWCAVWLTTNKRLIIPMSAEAFEEYRFTELVRFREKMNSTLTAQVA